MDARRSAPAPDGSSAPLLRLTVRWARVLFLSPSSPSSSALGPAGDAPFAWVHPAAGCGAGSTAVLLRHTQRSNMPCEYDCTVALTHSAKLVIAVPCGATLAVKPTLASIVTGLQPRTDWMPTPSRWVCPRSCRRRRAPAAAALRRPARWRAASSSWRWSGRGSRRSPL